MSSHCYDEYIKHRCAVGVICNTHMDEKQRCTGVCVCFCVFLCARMCVCAVNSGELCTRPGRSSLGNDRLKWSGAGLVCFAGGGNSTGSLRLSSTEQSITHSSDSSQPRRTPH